MVFNAAELAVKGGIVMIVLPGYNDFLTPLFRKGGHVGAGTVDMSTVKLGVRTAAEVIRKSGNEMAFWSATLEKPVIKGVEEPYYLFSMVDTGLLWIGATDGKIRDEIE